MNKFKRLMGGVFVSIVLCTLLFSCKNFFNSESLDDLRKVMDYVNSDPFYVRFSAEGGKISPSGDYSVRVQDQIKIIFNCENSKCFINWEVFEGNRLLSKQEMSQYVQFDNPDDPETTVHILQKADNLKIQAKTVDRPKIVSTTPVFDLEGSYRDRRITIMFDQFLDKDSIYFTQEELAEAGVWDSENDCAYPEYTLLDKNGDKKYFGYQKTGDDNSIVWKVAVITKRTDRTANLLSCYECPEFEVDDTSVLRITAKNDIQQMPPVNTNILVIIKTAFGKHEKTVSGSEKLVSIDTECSWSYLTNSWYDSAPPKFDELILYNVKGEHTKYEGDIENCDELINYKNNTQKDSVDLLNTIDKTPTSIPKFNVTDKKIWIKATVNDSGSGPKSLSAKVTKVDNQYYPCEKDKLMEKLGYTANLSIIGPNATVYSDDHYNGEFFDLSEIQEEGLYKITFTATDKNDLTSTKDAYFIYDAKGPAQPVVYIGGMDKGIRVCVDGSYVADINNIEISGADTHASKQGEYSAKFTGKTNALSYTYSVKTVDFAGNESQVTTVSGKAGISVGDYCYLVNDKDIVFSSGIQNGGKNMVGIVISDSVDSTSKLETTKIMRITVDENKSVVYNHPNTAVYDKTYGAGVDNQTDHGEIFYQSIVNNNKLEDFPKIKHLYYDVNNENKNTITWYLPGLNELLPLNGYWNGPRAAINNSLSNIPTSIKHMKWLGDGMSEMVTCTFNNENSSTPKFSVVYFNKVDYEYYQLKSFSTHATYSLLMAHINPAY